MPENESRSLVAVDIGNSAAKFYLFSLDDDIECPEPIKDARSRLTDMTGSDWFQHVIADLVADVDPTTVHWSIASVNDPFKTLVLDCISNYRPLDRVACLTNGNVPIRARVDQPDCVGIDRLLNAVAVAKVKSPACPAIVIDAGSAITVDCVSGDGDFLGGAILPGLQMQLSVLSKGTDQLPPLEFDHSSEKAIGASTENAIRTGVGRGAIGAIRELMASMQEQFGNDANLFFTGGDARHFHELFCNQSQHIPHLVGLGILHAVRQMAIL